MAKVGYIGVDGKARKIIKGYIGVNGIARKLKKCYIGVDGIARATWGGVTWRKYNCTTSTTYTEDTANIGFSSTMSYSGVTTSTFYSSCSFSRSSGYSLTGAVTLAIENSVGYYVGHSNQVFQITGVTKHSSNQFTCSTKCVGTCWSFTSYNKGTTFYGEITADEDVLPEEGKLVNGSIDGDYCVINVNGTNYYYEKPKPTLAVLDNSSILNCSVLS